MVVSSEKVSSEYLAVNSCNRQSIEGYSMGSLREPGRCDYHILYIAEGCCYIREGEEEIPVPAGSVVLYLPLERQEYMFYEETPSVSYYMHFSGTGCEEILKKLRLYGKRVITVGKSKTIEKAYDKMIEEFFSKRPFFEDFCAEALWRILLLIARRAEYSSGSVERIDDRIFKVQKLMQEEYDQNLPVSHYAELCNLSESRFLHVFKAQIGVSPARFLQDIKLEQAKSLLENTDMPISRISQNLGFCDQNYFSRVFKKRVGVSPVKFRESVG